MEVVETIGEFLIALKQAGRSASTLKQYKWQLDRLVSQVGVTRLEDLSRSVLRRWGASIADVWSPAMCRQAVSAARSWLRWCQDEYDVGGDLVSALALPRVPTKRQRTLRPDEVRLLLDACDGSLVGIRNKALVSLFVDSGLRASEICRLRVGDLSLDGGVLSVVVKGGDEELGFFGDTTSRRLCAWLAVRPAAPGVGTVFVSCGGSRPGQPLTRDGLRSVLRRLGHQAGVPGVCAHAFRRSFACISTRAGTSARVVQLAGRWSNISMVERYTRDFDVLEAGELHRDRSPADWLEREM